MTGLDPKKVKKAVKEGGKKAQDVAGMAAFGCHFFCVTLTDCEGDMGLLELAMGAMNKVVDESGDDRKGGAGDIGKILFSAGDNDLCMLCHVPTELTSQLTAKDWCSAVFGAIGASVVVSADGLIRGHVKQDPEKDRFVLKLRDQAIAAGFELLREKGLVLDDESDDDINFADSAGIDLNAGAEGDY